MTAFITEEQKLLDHVHSLPDIILLAECLIQCDGNSWYIVYIPSDQNMRVIEMNEHPDLSCQQRIWSCFYRNF